MDRELRALGGPKVPGLVPDEAGELCQGLTGDAERGSSALAARQGRAAKAGADTGRRARSIATLPR
eukprot:14683908-Alexandrium_andersonii.AAC.1